MILVDTHCHLNHPPLCLDTDGVLARAAAAQVTRVVAPAYDTTSWDDLTALAARPGVAVAYGLHPWLAHDLPGQVAVLEGGRPATHAEPQPAAALPQPVPPAAQAAALERLLEHLAARIAAGRPVAIGEIGLDTKITASGLALQLPLLERQLALAVDLDLPVILHCRGAFEELLAAVGRHGGRLRGVLHAFSRGPDLAARVTAAGLYLALGGAVTRERAQQVRRAARTASLDRLVLETDAPSIGLQDVPPERTEPRHVREVAAAVATLRGEPVESVAAATTAAAARLFGP
jgi:TatD DNase family protein